MCVGSACNSDGRHLLPLHKLGWEADEWMNFSEIGWLVTLNTRPISSCDWYVEPEVGLVISISGIVSIRRKLLTTEQPSLR